LADVPGIAVRVADLETGRWPYAPSEFDAIVVTNFLHRPLFAGMLASLKETGALIYETFMAGNERYGKPSRAEFLLRPGELLELAGTRLQVVAFEQGYVDQPKPA